MNLIQGIDAPSNLPVGLDHTLILPPYPLSDRGPTDDIRPSSGSNSQQSFQPKQETTKDTHYSKPLILDTSWLWSLSG